MMGVALAVPIAIVAHAESYLTENQATAVLFPGVKFQSSWVDLSAAQIKAIEDKSGVQVPTSHIRIWWGANREVVIVDTVLGKHELITYAVGLTPAGKVRGVEIMDYRENFGQQIRKKEWRNQFEGKDVNSPVRIDKDIRNISGATLSSVHVTNGVRRVIQTYELIR